MLLKFFLVGLGGALGSVLRYAVTLMMERLNLTHFPLGTLVVNVAGCLAIGFLSVAFAGRWIDRDEMRVAVLVGVLGGLTTFSSYAWETLARATGGEAGLALATILSNNVLGLGAAWLGFILANRYMPA